MFILNIIVTRAFHPKFTNSLSKLPKVTIKAKSENIVTKFARPFDMTIWICAYTVKSPILPAGTNLFDRNC